MDQARYGNDYKSTTICKEFYRSSDISWGIHRAFSKTIETFYSQPSPFDFSTFNDFKIDSDNVHGFWLDLGCHN